MYFYCAGILPDLYLAEDSVPMIPYMDLTPPAAVTKRFKVMGKEFDPARPEDYVKSFAIRRV